MTGRSYKCARAFEEKHPEYKGRCWPPQGQDIEKLSEELTRECDEDDNPYEIPEEYCLGIIGAHDETT